MVLALHIWGPAYGEASIDPDCLAAAELFRHVLPRDAWVLVASNDAAPESHHTLPALVDDEGTWTSGYTNIVQYLANHGLSSIDSDLTPLQTADAAACTAYLSTRGSALLALALYVSHSAWVGMTRPAYSQLLPFPLTWTIPPSIRTAAIEKVEHLGLGHLAASVDDLDDPSLSSGSGATTTPTGFLQLPARFGPSKTLQPEQTAAIRLQSLADDFFGVVQDYGAGGGGRAGGNKFLFDRDEPSSTDFLIFAYLKLMRVQTPQPFLRNALQKSFPGLWSFSDPPHLGQFSKQQPVSPPEESAATAQDSPSSLPPFPWQEPRPRGLAAILGRFADTAIGHIPSVGPGWTRFRYMQQSSQDPASALQAAFTIGATGTAAVAVGALALFIRNLAPLGAAVHSFDASTYPVPASEQQDAVDGGEGAKGGFHRFGSDLGAMLNHLPDFGPTGKVIPSMAAGTTDKVYDNAVVEVDVDVEPVPLLSARAGSVGVGM
ncbi:Tom37 C-terminal domain-containing protein [Microdochium trichocladiopsis]|uniref:Tom37 C-terminal domain-containing protein n=1 Tax=Microdochium trichocladiopsis TaxID=1682393 RepID=A0A9P9BJT6_9PEZI|nr:Tom37 C-terminal domain-containing protein [Microdochium trichocladiopsis]KAH7018420.1 Tom37 C-terminal domain-containing protein [Microdochium trichocladiopsis]